MEPTILGPSDAHQTLKGCSLVCLVWAHCIRGALWNYVTSFVVLYTTDCLYLCHRFCRAQRGHAPRPHICARLLPLLTLSLLAHGHRQHSSLRTLPLQHSHLGTNPPQPPHSPAVVPIHLYVRTHLLFPILRRYIFIISSVPLTGRFWSAS